MMWKFSSKPLLRQYAVVIIVNLSIVVMGLGLVWPSPVLIKLRAANQTVLPYPITDDTGAWIVSISSLTGTFANLFIPYLVRSIGRKYCAILSIAPRILIGLLYIFASQVWMLLLGRAVTGALDNLSITVVSMYASEVASKEVRGSLGTILQICSSVGVLMMLAFGPFTPYLPLNIIYTCIAAATTIPVFLLPDSPYFLYSKGRTEEARKVLIHLRGSEGLANNELKEYASSNTDGKVNTLDLLKNRIILKTIGIAIVICIGIQFIGFNAVSFYLQTILESTQTSIMPETASVIIGCIQLTASVCTAFISDRFGRKPILTVSLAGQALGMFGIGLFFKLRGNSETVSGVMNFIPLASLILVVFGFSAGPGSVTWLLLSELFEGPSRAAGMGTGLFFTNLALFLTTRYFPTVTNNIGPAVTYWFFGVMCIVLMLFILFCVPETKGKSFAEIQTSLGAETNPEIGLDKNVNTTQKQSFR